MKKILKKIIRYCLILVLSLLIVGASFPLFARAQTIGAKCIVEKTGAAGTWQKRRGSEELFCRADDQAAAAQAYNINSGEICLWGGACWIAKVVGGFASGILLPLAGWVTWFSGMILNYVIQWTVVDMKKNLDEDSINNIWRTIRDLGNMTFIFFLLFAAIKQILGIGGDNKKLITTIVVVSILINFSLFFTKVVIDISNILAIALYDAAAYGALEENVNRGLANSLMEPLKIQTIWKAGNNLSDYSLLVAGIMGMTVALIAAFIFLAISILFIMRFVVLIIVLALSPVYFLSLVLPELKKYGEQWKQALIGQSFFAPIFFLMMWIVIKISRGVLKGLQDGDMASVVGGVSGNLGVPPPPQSVGIFVNYAIIIALLITAMTLAKDWANKAGGGINKLTSWAMGAAGGMTVGLAGRLGRGTLGRAGNVAAESEWLKDKASKGGIGGMSARLALATSRKTAGASFDMRSTELSGITGMGKGQKGGFAKDLKDKVKAQKDYADKFKPSDLAVSSAERELDDVKKNGTRAQIEAAQAKLDKLKGVTEEEARKREVRRLQEEAIAAGGYLKEKDAKRQVATKENERLRAIMRLQRDEGLTRKQAEERADAERIGLKLQTIKGVANERKESYAKVTEEQTTQIPKTDVRLPISLTGGRIFGLIGPVKRERKEEALSIRKSMKEKKSTEKLVEEIEKAKEGDDDSAEPETTTPPVTPTQ